MEVVAAELAQDEGQVCTVAEAAGGGQRSGGEGAGFATRRAKPGTRVSGETGAMGGNDEP